MLLWIMIFIFVIISAGIAFFYLANCISRFSFVQKIAKSRRFVEFIIGAAIVLIAAAALYLIWDTVNTIICLLHLAIFFLIGDLVFFITRKILKRRQPPARLTKLLPRLRNIFGAAAIFITITYLSFGYILAHRVWQKDYIIKTDKNVGNIKIALIADSHIGTTFNSNGFAENLETIAAQKPDILIIAGDFADEGTTKKDMIASCRALGKFPAPYGVYFVFGNHDKGTYSQGERGYDGDDLTAELQKNGVTVLSDESLLIDDRFYIVGRKDASEEYEMGKSRADTEKLLRNLDKSKYLIVVDHQPRDYNAQSKSEADLVLSGHTHGGQLIPIMQISNLTGLGGNDSIYGKSRINSTDFIVTSGISDWSIQFKTGCRSEYLIINIKGK